MEYLNIRQLILELNARKPMGIDTISPKIIKMLNDNICDNIESHCQFNDYFIAVS